MKLGWRSRHALALLILALVLVVISSIFEITNVLRLSTDRAATEATLAIEPVQQIIAQLSEQRPEATIAELAQDPQVKRVLTPALAFAPSVATIIVCDPRGIAVAHAIPGNRGRPIDRLPPFPRPQGFRGAFALLLELRDRQNYEITADLIRGDREFGSVRAHISGTLLGDEVRRVLRRGLLTAGIDILLAVGVGLLLGRTVSGPVRLLEKSVVAIREGRDEPIPEKGVEMFEHLARELNILRDRVQMEPRVLASVGQLATGLAHEIQQPIQAVKFAVSALRDARDMPGDEVDGYVDDAKRAVDRLHNAVNGFLTVVRLKPMHLSSVDLNALLTDIRDVLETGRT
ncbi:MAG: histidine kinase dimerization/phospho-acceptor domain-containing protein [Candidatus Eisenbacteria bacterium]